MKSATTELKAHLALQSTRLCFLLKITRTDGQVFAFTNHDRDLVFDGVTYRAKDGLVGSAVQSKSDMSADNQEAKFFPEDDAITERDFRAGLFDGADVEIREVNWADLTQGALKLRKGTIGDGTIERGQMSAQVNGLLQKLATVIGNYYGPVCRAQLGDSKCTVNLADFRQNGTVSSSADAYHITPGAGLTKVGSASPTDPAGAGWFDDGIIDFTSGGNSGLSYQIASWDGTTLTLRNPLFLAPDSGDTFTIEPGCNHDSDADRGDCQNKFSNIINFQGEPFIPGQNQIADWPDKPPQQ